MARRVDVRPVDEPVGVARLLHALVPASARVGIDAPAVQHRAPLGELVRLRRVDDVAGHEHGLRADAVDRPHRGGEGLRRERLLRPEGRVDRVAQAVEERDPGGRLLVAHVRVGELGERGEHAPRGAEAPAEVAPVVQRLAGAGLEEPVAVAVDERRAQGRAGRGRSGRGRGAAAGHGQRGRDEDGPPAPP
jgi:hypothetical protein